MILDIEEIKYDKAINEENIKKFSKYFLKSMNKKVFVCVCCKKATSLENSQSIKGDLLVCGNCAYTLFEDAWAGVEKWQIQNKEKQK